MANPICSSLKDALLATFSRELEVTTAADNLCVVTLPLRTADDRYINVFVEPMTGSDAFCYVHDGGKNTAELWAQGIHTTDSQERMMKGIASANGAQFHNGRFQILCKNIDEIQIAVLSIAQCATLAMIDVVTHVPNIQDEALASRVARSLNEWRPSYVEIQRRVTVEGKTHLAHTFDFVSKPVKPRKRTVAIKLLPPSVGPPWQVSRYGFLALDLGNREAGKWSRLAIVTRADEWSANTLEAIQSFSADTLMLKTDEEDQLERLLPHKMTRLTDAT